MEFEKLILKFIYNSKGSRVTETLLKNRKKVEVLVPPDINIYYKTMVIKIRIDKWTNGTEKRI